MNHWIAAVIAIVAGVLVGVLVSRLVARSVRRSRIEALRTSATPLAGLALAIGVVAGLLVALGLVASNDLQTLGTDAIGILPRIITALIIVIAANVTSVFAATAIRGSLAGAGAAARLAPVVARMAILVGGSVVAASAIGVDTTIINIGAAAVLFGIAGSAALLVGLGGRQVAGHLAAGRSWKRSLQPGDRIKARLDGGETVVDGIVVAVNPTTVEVAMEGSTLLVPNAQLLETVVERTRVTRAGASPTAPTPPSRPTTEPLRETL